MRQLQDKRQEDLADYNEGNDRSDHRNAGSSRCAQGTGEYLMNAEREIERAHASDAAGTRFNDLGIL